jgi:hypothetical protein
VKTLAWEEVVHDDEANARSKEDPLLRGTKSPSAHEQNSFAALASAHERKK